MSSDRFVLLGLAPPRAPWFEALAQWSNSAAIAAEFVKCVSAEEVRARLSSGRRHSALLVDASSPSVDRDLVRAATDAGTPVIVVRDQRGGAPSASDIGAVDELPWDFNRDDLLESLSVHCTAVGRGDGLPPALSSQPGLMWMGRLFTVCGPGGTGASTIAIALAQGFAGDARYGRRVLLADLARNADQAMLHDAPDLGPGVQELVEAHRVGAPGPEDVRRSTFDVSRRGYQLLLGLRQPHAWASLRPRSVDAAIDGLRQAFQVVVADATGDFEGEGDGGSADVEERNHLARSAALSSTVVLAVGAPGMKGVHSLARLIRQLAAAGVAHERILPVVNRAPRNPRSRAEISRALASLLESDGVGGLAVASPVPVPERKVEDALRDGSPLPSQLTEPVRRAVDAVAERLADSPPASAGPQRITPGSLGTWPDAAEYGAGNT